MPVEFSCDGCNRRLRAPDTKAGKRVNCPNCGRELTIPVMGMPSAISLSPADAASPNPLEQLPISLPTAAEAMSQFGLTSSAGKPGGDLEIGLAEVDEPKAPAAASNPANPAASSASAPLSLKPAAKPGTPPTEPTASSQSIPLVLEPAAPKAGAAPPPDVKPPAAASGAPKKPAASGQSGAPGQPGTPRQAGAAGVQYRFVPSKRASAKPLSAPGAGLAPVSSPPSAANPLDDIFKDLPPAAAAPFGQPAASTFGGPQPIASAGAFASAGAALPKAAVPKWNPPSAPAPNNPYASPLTGGRGSFGGANYEVVRVKVMPPAILLIICYSLWCVYSVANIAFNIPLLMELSNDTSAPSGVSSARIVGMSLVPVLAIAGLVGSIKMVRMRSWGSALIASIMAIFPFCFCFPIGIWSIIVLSMGDVRHIFAMNDRRAG